MDTPVTVALIASLGSLLVAVSNLFWNTYQKKQEQRLAARAELDRYREPLLNAVDELGNRIDNIRKRGFFSYLDDESRRDAALRSTSFRLAQYFGWIEILYGYSGHLRFASDSKTKPICDTISWIASTFASDGYDQKKSGDFTTSQLMIWREEQRAIGELMHRDSATPACVGYSSFVNNYDDRHLKWLAAFERQLASMYSGRLTGKTPNSERLDRLHALLAKLLVELDVGKALTEFDENGWVKNPQWAQPGRFSKLPPPQPGPQPPAADRIIRVLRDHMARRRKSPSERGMTN